MQESFGVRGNKILFDEFSLEHDIDAILGIRFQNDELSKTIDDLYDPYLLCDMDKAVARIKLAHANGERVVIFGDYDVDGVTSTAILMHFFKKIGLVASYRLPHRVHDGYGLKKHFIDDIKKHDATLLITVDCGSRDVEVIRYAKSLGIDVIVTDHHAVPEIIPPEAIAIINPKRTDCPYPFKYLSGAGVAFKLMMALAKDFLKETEYTKYLQESIDIAAIGTVADCMSLTGENRIIVQEGLKQLKNSRSKGIRKLIEHKIEEDLDADIFGFTIGPRLNAAGRMDTPYKALHLLLNQEDSVMDTLLDIEMLNDKRRTSTTHFLEKALEGVNPKDNILFYSDEQIEHGIIGIVAGRLTENFYKPAIVLTSSGENYVASCRSPDYFDIVGLLENFKEYFSAFGGHKQAAGFTILKDRFPEFKKGVLLKINALDFTTFKKTIVVDKLLKSHEIGFNLLQKINKYKPFGLGNPKPIFMLKDFHFDQVSYLGKGVEHIKFTNSFGYKVCGFGFGQYMDDIKSAENISIVFDISEDNYNGNKSLLLKILDIIT